MKNIKQKTRSKTKPNAQLDLKRLAETLDIEFTKNLQLIPLPDGSIAYKDYFVKQNKVGNWCIYRRTTGADVYGTFNLKTCALIAAKALHFTHLDKYNEVKQLDSKYWSNYTRTSVYKYNMKSTKDYERYLILLNKLEDSTWKASHYKDEISRMFRWSFV